MKFPILFLPLTALLAYAAPADVTADPNSQMTACLRVCNEQAAQYAGCLKGYVDSDCTCPSIPYLHFLMRCLKYGCPASDWEISKKLHIEVCKTPLEVVSLDAVDSFVF